MTEQMTCQKYRSHLDEWLDGELSQDLAAAMQAHRENCAECDEETRLAEESLELIHSLEPEEPVPLPVQAAWRNAVRKEARQRTRLHWNTGMRAISAAAASFIALVGCTIGFRSSGMLDVPAGKAMQTEAAADVRDTMAYSRMTSSALPRAEASSAARYTYIASDSAVKTAAAEPTAQEDSGAEMYSALEAEELAEIPMAASSTAEADMAAFTPVSASPMLIRSVSRTIATSAFDSDAQSVRDLTQQYEGYLAVDSTATQPDGKRISEYTCVLPETEVDNFLQALDHIGSITFSAEYFTDVTADVQDVSAQLNVLHAEEARLTELIGEATAEELLALNGQLQSVLTEIDMLESRSSRLSTDLDHVNVSVRLEEQTLVHTAEPTLAPTLTERMGSAFTSSAENLKSFARDMLVSLMVIAPFLLAAAGCAVIAIIIFRLIRRMRRSGK